VFCKASFITVYSLTIKFFAFSCQSSHKKCTICRDSFAPHYTLRSSNLELRISYGSGLSSPMFDVCRLDRLCASSLSDTISSLVASADLTFRARLPNVSTMSSNLGNWNELPWWTIQQEKQTSENNRGNFMPWQSTVVLFQFFVFPLCHCTENNITKVIITTLSNHHSNDYYYVYL